MDFNFALHMEELKIETVVQQILEVNIFWAQKNPIKLKNCSIIYLLKD